MPLFSFGGKNEFVAGHILMEYVVSRLFVCSTLVSTTNGQCFLECVPIQSVNRQALKQAGWIYLHLVVNFRYNHIPCNKPAWIGDKTSGLPRLIGRWSRGRGFRVGTNGRPLWPIVWWASGRLWCGCWSTDRWFGWHTIILVRYKCSDCGKWVIILEHQSNSLWKEFKSDLPLRFRGTGMEYCARETFDWWF